MSPRAAWRLESLGFTQVYDYVGGKMDWFAAGLPLEGEVADATLLGRLARHDVPTCRFTETVGAVRERVRSAGWTSAIVVNAPRVVLGVLEGGALGGDPAMTVEAAMEPGPVTFRPNASVEETAAWMDRKGVDSVLVTSSDGTLIGVVRREDLGHA
jgi:CBS domain-containing protein